MAIQSMMEVAQNGVSDTPHGASLTLVYCTVIIV